MARDGTYILSRFPCPSLEREICAGKSIKMLHNPWRLQSAQPNGTTNLNIYMKDPAEEAFQQEVSWWQKEKNCTEPIRLALKDECFWAKKRGEWSLHVQICLAPPPSGTKLTNFLMKGQFSVIWYHTFWPQRPSIRWSTSDLPRPDPQILVVAVPELHSYKPGSFLVGHEGWVRFVRMGMLL